MAARQEQKVVEEQKILEMVLLYVALEDLRRRWRQRETPLDPYLYEKVKKFKRVRILKDRPIRICGSDGGLLAYGVALNEPELMKTLFELIKALPKPRHYKIRGRSVVNTSLVTG